MHWTRKRGEAGGKLCGLFRVLVSRVSSKAVAWPRRVPPCSVLLAADPVRQPPGSQVQAMVVGCVPERQRSIFPL